jgi:uncharacterized protein (DUF1015 family)
MPTVRPFTGLIFDQAVAGPFDKVTSPPYDVISPTDLDRYYRLSPYNVIRLILGKDEPHDDAALNKYTRAASYLRSWRERGVIEETRTPALYPYEFEFHLGGTRRRLRGVIAEIGLEPWGGSIIPHERTLPGHVEDRLALLRAVRANLSPIYAVVAGPVPALSSFLEAPMSTPPAREMIDEAGTTHRIWVAHKGVDPVCEALSHESLMIADGHHRYSVALAFRDEMVRRVGPGSWDSMMMLVVDARTEDPPVLPIHRLVRTGDRGRMRPADGPAETGETVRDMAEILASVNDDRLTYGFVRLEDGDIVHRVATLAGPPPTVYALHEQILDRLQGVELRFVPDSLTAERAVASGQAATAYLLPPTRVELVWNVVRSGGKLPQKSTYFWPKPRTGMIIRPLQTI